MVDFQEEMVGFDRDALASLGLDGELDFIKVRPVFVRGSLECLERGELGIGSDRFNVFEDTS